MTSKSTSSDTALEQSASGADEPAARSRSEIETALSGQTTRNKNRTRPTPSKTFDLSAPPRRQQVIGGDLTGVAKRTKFGVFSRYSDISIMNWVAVAIALLILVAFFWPQENNSTQEILDSGVTLSPQLGETDLSEDEQIDFLKSEAGESSLSFSRDDDLVRAGDYRQQDAKELKIRSLLDKAKAEIEDGKYTQPSGSNAVESYNDVLALSATNIQAKQGLNYINTRFLIAGLSALEQNNKSAAENALDKLAFIDQGSEGYQELAGAINTWNIRRKVLIFLANAKSAYAKRALILPAKANALYFYQQALLLDQNNTVALTGIQKIADNYIQFANDAVLNGQFEAASAHLATVSVIDSSHSSIPLIEAMITRAQPLAELALEAQLRRLEQQNESPKNESPVEASPLASPSGELTRDNDTRTPRQQTSEQESFDKQYLKQGLESYYKGEYDTASALLQPLADKGIARAQFRLAYMHFLGRGFKQDLAAAINIIGAALPAIQKFANEGRSWAQADLGSLYEDGLVLGQNYADAVYWYRSAAEQGDPGAQTNLGLMYARGQGVTASRSTAIEWFQRAAKQGDVIAQANLETMAEN